MPHLIGCEVPLTLLSRRHVPNSLRIFTAPLALQSGLLRTSRLEDWVHHCHDRPRCCSASCICGLGEVLLARALHPLQVPQGSHDSRCLPRLWTYVLLDLVSICYFTSAIT